MHPELARIDVHMPVGVGLRIGLAALELEPGSLAGGIGVEDQDDAADTPDVVGLEASLGIRARALAAGQVQHVVARASERHEFLELGRVSNRIGRYAGRRIGRRGNGAGSVAS